MDQFPNMRGCSRSKRKEEAGRSAESGCQVGESDEVERKASQRRPAGCIASFLKGVVEIRDML